MIKRKPPADPVETLLAEAEALIDSMRGELVEHPQFGRWARVGEELNTLSAQARR